MRSVLIGKKDDAQLLVVDTQLMTVTALDATATTTFAERIRPQDRSPAGSARVTA